MTDRLTISFWIWGIFNTKPNPCYDDMDSRMVELKERGFNCIRLESGAGLCHDRHGKPRGELNFQEALPGHGRLIRQMERTARFSEQVRRHCAAIVGIETLHVEVF